MFYIVNKYDPMNEIEDQLLGKCDAWDIKTQNEMERIVFESGYELVEREITLMGDMIVWVKKVA